MKMRNKKQQPLRGEKGIEDPRRPTQEKSVSGQRAGWGEERRKRKPGNKARHKPKDKLLVQGLTNSALVTNHLTGYLNGTLHKSRLWVKPAH